MWTPLRICRQQQMSSDNGQQDCVCDLSITELNELDMVEFQGRDDDYAPGVILHKGLEVI